MADAQMSSYFISVLSLFLTEFSYLSVPCTCLCSSGYKLFTFQIELKLFAIWGAQRVVVLLPCLAGPSLCKAWACPAIELGPKTAVLDWESTCGCVDSNVVILGRESLCGCVDVNGVVLDRESTCGCVDGNVVDISDLTTHSLLTF